MCKYILAIFILVIVSCTKTSNTKDLEFQWNIVKVEGSLIGNLNQPIALTVYWPFASGCDNVDKFEESRQGDVIFITTYGHSAEAGSICTTDAGIKAKIYNFTSKDIGVFELRFLNRDNSFISHFITIN